MAKPATRWFYANIEWFEPAEQPDSVSDLPPKLAEAEALIGCPKSASSGLELLSRYVTAVFLPTNLENHEDLFETDPDADFVEITASKLRVVAADFASSPLPRVRAEAAFQVPVTSGFSKVDLDAWQESNSSLTDAVAFSWSLGDNAATEHLDLTMGDHLGMECVSMNKCPF